MRRLLMLIALIIPIASPGIAFTKSEALACVNRGIAAFLAGGPIDHLVDIPYVMNREKIVAEEASVAALLNTRAAENKANFRDVSAFVQGAPQAKSKGYFLIAGRVEGFKRETTDSPWKHFDYSYDIWAKPAPGGCQIGVFAIENAFRLGGWVKSKL